MGQTHFGKLMVELCFSKRCCVVLWPYYIWLYMKMHILIAYRELHDLLERKRLASLIKFLRMRFMDLLHCLQKYIDALSWPILFGKLIQNLFDKKWVEGSENLVNILGIQIFYETTWKWIMYFELKVICELFIFYPCAVTCDYSVIT